MIYVYQIRPLSSGQKRGTMKNITMKKCITACLSVLLIFSLFFSVGCSRKESEENNQNSSYEDESETESSAEIDVATSEPLFDFSLYDSNITYTSEDLEVQKEFEAYLTEIFSALYAQNTISFNFLIENPETYGITRLPSTWPKSDSNQLTELFDMETKWLDKLEDFTYTSLTYEQQIIYDSIKNSFEDDLKYQDTVVFLSSFGANGLSSQLPIIFTEYSFRTKEDIEEYLGLLETLKDYISSELELEHERMNGGHALSGYTYEMVIDQCQAFLDQGENYLVNIFTGKLDEFGTLTAEERAAYEKRNKDAITNSVLPAYHLMIDTLTSYQQEKEYNEGLATIDGGKEYYEYLLKSNVGTSKTPEELITLIEEKLTGYQTELTTLLAFHPDIYDVLMEPEYDYTQPDEIINHCIEELTKDFPAPVCTNYTLNETDDALSDELVTAFYILSPIDNFKNNIIYINPDHVEEGNSLFPTLAHEGLPGHMYQHNYFYNLNPHYFRSALNMTGYSEGWATYVEMYSYNWTGLDSSAAKALKINSLYSEALSCRIDLGVNYEGWTLEDTVDYFAELGITDEETATIFYDTVVSAPCMYCPYYIGYLELEELKESAESTLDSSFCIKDFHKFYLEIGPTYFDIIEDRMETWMETLKNGGN